MYSGLHYHSWLEQLMLLQPCPYRQHGRAIYTPISSHLWVVVTQWVWSELHNSHVPFALCVASQVQPWITSDHSGPGRSLLSSSMTKYRAWENILDLCSYKSRSTEIHRDPQRSTEVHRDPKRSKEIHRDAQRSTEVHSDPKRSKEIHRDPQRSTEVHSDPKRSIEIHKDPQRSREFHRGQKISTKMCRDK